MGFFIEGKKREKLFMEDILSDNLDKWREATPQEDANGHIDIQSQDGLISIDIKGLKKLKRSDGVFEENYHWVELQNVNGDRGSLYGDATHIAFEIQRHWVVVKRVVLVELIEKNLKDVLVSSPYNACYCRYKREGRNDCITLVPITDLMAISDANIPKKFGVVDYPVGESILYEDRVKKKNRDDQKYVNFLLAKKD